MIFCQTKPMMFPKVLNSAKLGFLKPYSDDKVNWLSVNIDEDEDILRDFAEKSKCFETLYLTNTPSWSRG
jgi:hypothetical protein